MSSKDIQKGEKLSKRRATKQEIYLLKQFLPKEWRKKIAEESGLTIGGVSYAINRGIIESPAWIAAARLSAQVKAEAEEARKIILGTI